MTAQSHSLVPPEDWVTDPDPEQYDMPCPACSAVVDNRAVHRAWHLAILDRADRYVSPSLYGGTIR